MRGLCHCIRSGPEESAGAQWHAGGMEDEVTGTGTDLPLLWCCVGRGMRRWLRFADVCEVLAYNVQHQTVCMRESWEVDSCPR